MQAATSIEKFRNAQVIVTEEKLAPGEKVSLSPNYPCELIILNGRTVELVRENTKIRNETVDRGSTLFEPAGSGRILNTNPSELRYVRVEFLNQGTEGTWGMTGLPPAYKILLENRYTRTYEIKISAGGMEPQHTHHARVVVCLEGAELEHILPSGEHQPSTLKTGEITWRPGATHIGHNMGSTDLWVVAIEPK